MLPRAHKTIGHLTARKDVLRFVKKADICELQIETRHWPFHKNATVFSEYSHNHLFILCLTFKVMRRSFNIYCHQIERPCQKQSVSRNHIVSCILSNHKFTAFSYPQTTKSISMIFRYILKYVKTQKVDTENSIFNFIRIFKRSFQLFG